MLPRRRFLFLLGGAATGVWLATTGLVRLERRFVLALGGSCSFCGKDRAEVKTLVGTFGQPPKICDECIGLSCDIIAEEVGYQPPVSRSQEAAMGEPGVDDHIGEILRRLAEERDSRRTEALLADVRRSFDAGPPRLAEFRCSFCDGGRSTSEPGNHSLPISSKDQGTDVSNAQNTATPGRLLPREIVRGIRRSEGDQSSLEPPDQ